MDVPSSPSPLIGVLETVLYFEAGQEDALERFYTDVVGLGFMGRGRTSLGFRVGPGAVLLLFEAAKSSVQDEPPPHGATGKIHTCFLASGADDYDAWKERIAAQVEIIDEITWDESGLRSFYFDDPAGNVLEIAEGDLWVD
jgi:catechol-2,3-dioxygenase